MAFVGPQVDGGWSPWSTISSSCESQMRIRSRQCDGLTMPGRLFSTCLEHDVEAQPCPQNTLSGKSEYRS